MGAITPTTSCLCLHKPHVARRMASLRTVSGGSALRADGLPGAFLLRPQTPTKSSQKYQSSFPHATLVLSLARSSDLPIIRLHYGLLYCSASTKFKPHPLYFDLYCQRYLSSVPQSLSIMTVKKVFTQIHRFKETDTADCDQ